MISRATRGAGHPLGGWCRRFSLSLSIPRIRHSTFHTSPASPQAGGGAGLFYFVGVFGGAGMAGLVGAANLLLEYLKLFRASVDASWGGRLGQPERGGLLLYKFAIQDLLV